MKNYREEFDFYEYGRAHAKEFLQTISTQTKLIAKEYGTDAAEDFMIGYAASVSAFKDLFVESSREYLKKEQLIHGTKRPVAKQEKYHPAPIENEPYVGKLMETEEERKKRLSEENKGMHR